MLLLDVINRFVPVFDNWIANCTELLSVSSKTTSFEARKRWNFVEKHQNFVAKKRDYITRLENGHHKIEIEDGVSADGKIINIFHSVTVGLKHGANH